MGDKVICKHITKPQHYLCCQPTLSCPGFPTSSPLPWLSLGGSAPLLPPGFLSAPNHLAVMPITISQHPLLVQCVHTQTTTWKKNLILGSRSRQVWVLILHPPLPSDATSVELLHSSVPHLCSEANILYPHKSM